MSRHDDHDEWLEPDGLGGFASGTASGIRTRRYHALLLTATTPPTGRVVLVNGFDAWIETPAGRFALTSQRYAPGVIHPDGAGRTSAFSIDPWPCWTLLIEDGTTVEQTIVVQHGTPLVTIVWRLTGNARPLRALLSVRPFLSGRDAHSTHHENPAFRFDPEHRDDRLIWRPYNGVPAIHAISNGEYRHQPDWFRNFRYDEEAARGLDAIEDLASPGEFVWNLAERDACLVFVAEPEAETALPPGVAAHDLVTRARTSELTRREAFASRLHRAADAYLVKRGSGTTIVAGYPWFTDWGRDTFIALRGICLASDRVEEARRILLEWTATISEGMLPNRFPDRGEALEFNSVDASLWFVIAVYELFARAKARGSEIASADRDVLEKGVDAVLTRYAEGTRFGIRVDHDGLLAAGVPGLQLTWMDARVGGTAVTPRIGKPVEIQALWLNTLWFASERSQRWRTLFARGKASFQRFWNPATQALHDVIDVDHRPGTVDPSFRPNQIFALGGLPVVLVDDEQAKLALASIESRLWTPLGLRSLAPSEPGYIGHYGGDVSSRDRAYHQGTVWPWLLASFVDAWVRARGGRSDVIAEARQRFLTPLLAHLETAGLGHVSEIADGDFPHTPNGCPFQAWSVGEALRLQYDVLGPAQAGIVGSRLREGPPYV